MTLQFYCQKSTTGFLGKTDLKTEPATSGRDSALQSDSAMEDVFVTENGPYATCFRSIYRTKEIDQKCEKDCLEF